HLDPGGVAARGNRRPLALTDDAGHLILLHHEISRRRIERTREVVEGGEGGRGAVVFDLADETFGEPSSPGQLLNGQATTKHPIANLLTQLHGASAARMKGSEGRVREQRDYASSIRVSTICESARMPSVPSRAG